MKNRKKKIIYWNKVNWKNEVHVFLKDISPKLNARAWLRFELTYYDIILQNVSRYTTFTFCAIFSLFSSLFQCLSFFFYWNPLTTLFALLLLLLFLLLLLISSRSTSFFFFSSFLIYPLFEHLGWCNSEQARLASYYEWIRISQGASFTRPCATFKQM